MPKTNKKLAIVLSTCVAVLLLIMAGLYFASYNDDEIEEETTNVKQELGIENVDQIKSSANDDVDAFNLITSRAGILIESGDPEGAEEYYIEALELAKSTRDQNMIDTGYRLLLAYYKEFDMTTEYQNVAAEIGEEGVQRVFKSDPRDSEVLE